MIVSKDILERMYSAEHFKDEVNLTMTELAELLLSLDDNVFTVKFRKQPDADEVQKQLASSKPADLKAGAAANKLAKKLIAGEDCEMVCHLIKVENDLGRSLVIDLNSKHDNKFR